MSMYDSVSHTLILFKESVFMANLSSAFNSANDADRLVLLMIQKWLAAFLTPEFWYDWRRTGVQNSGANLIVRIKGT